MVSSLLLLGHVATVAWKSWWFSPMMLLLCVEWGAVSPGFIEHPGWYLFVKSQVLQSLSPLHHYLFCERKMRLNRGLLLWASWPFGSPKSRGRQGTNCVLLIHSPTRGPPSRRSIVDTEKIKVRPFNIDVSSPCFGIKYFVKIFYTSTNMCIYCICIIDLDVLGYTDIHDILYV